MAFYRQARDSQRDYPAHRPTGTIRFTLSGRDWFVSLLLRSSVLCQRRSRLPAKTEIGCIAPHAMEDDGKLAGDRNTGARHAPAFGDVHSPSAQARPFLRAFQRFMETLKRRW